MNQDFAATPNLFNDSTKRKQVDENNDYQDQNYPANADKTLTFGTDEKSSIHREMAKLNQELHYLGFGTLNHLDSCSFQLIDQIHKLYPLYDKRISSFLSSKNSQREKIKQIQAMLYKAQHQNHKLVRQSDILKNQVEELQRSKEEYTENVKQLYRDFRAKEDKHIKEKEFLIKEKKAIELRQQAIKNDFKKKDEKIVLLETKMRKMLDTKNEKIQYKNSFEVLQTFEIQVTNRSTIQQQCDALVLKSIKQKQQALQKENIDLKSYIRQIFDKLFRMVHYNPEEFQTKNEYNRYINLLSMSPEHTHTFIQITKNLIDKTGQMMHDKHNDVNKLLKNGSEEPNNLINTIQKMKFYYTQAQLLEQKRSKFATEIFNILDRKEKLNQTIIEKITNNLNDPHSSDLILYEEQMKHLQEHEQSFDKKDMEFNDNSSFIKEQIQYMNKKSKIIDIIQKDIQHVFGAHEQVQHLL